MNNEGSFMLFSVSPNCHGLFCPVDTYNKKKKALLGIQNGIVKAVS